MYTSYTPWRDPGKLNISQKWPEPFPKIPSSANDKMGGHQESTENKGMVVMQTSVIAFSFDKSFQRFGHVPFLGTMRESPLQMEISLILVNVSYKRVTSNQFSELLLCLQVLKNNQLKIMLMPEKHVLG